MGAAAAGENDFDLDDVDLASLDPDLMTHRPADGIALPPRPAADFGEYAGEAANGSNPRPPNAPPEEQDEEEEEEAAGAGGASEEIRRALLSRTSSALSGDDYAKVVKEWSRPDISVAGFFAAAPNLCFQQIDIDYTVGRPWEHLHPELRQSRAQSAIIRMYGVTATGQSVLAHVHGFEPYFFIDCPPGFESGPLEELLRCINAACAVPESKTHPHSHPSAGRGPGAAAPPLSAASNPVLRIERHVKQSIMYYRLQKPTTFLKVVTALPKNVPTVKGVLSKGITLPGNRRAKFTTYESDVLFVLRFMIDLSVVGGNWIELPAPKFKVRTTAQKQSSSQIEVDVFCDDVISHSPFSGEWQASMAPLRILSFDIECAGRKGVFPEPEIDPVIQIACVVSTYGKSLEEPLVEIIFTLNSCSPIAGKHVVCCPTEGQLLLNFRDFFDRVDPDIVTGYNIMNFDWPYLIQRAKFLAPSGGSKGGGGAGQSGNCELFPYFSRIVGNESRLKDTRFSSKAYGTRESHEVNMEGRVNIDVMQVVQRDHKLSSYSLNAVSAHFLKEQKEDVHHSIITDLQNGNSDTRRRLAVYCLKDAFLPLRLLQCLMIVPNYTEMARVTGVPIPFLLSRGQQIKVISQLLRKTRSKDLLVPTVSGSSGGGNGGASDEVGYEGATVIEPKRGFYDEPIATLDFASLYPSIMMAHNLCYSTLVPPADVPKLSPESYTKCPSGDVFVKAHVQKGILPEILEELLGARKRAKSDLKTATDPMTRAVLDGRQLALKVSANSVYGFTGATVGKLPCLEISASVTAFGREMIDMTKSAVEGHYPNAVVVYGDTDSVMVKFGVPIEKDEFATDDDRRRAALQRAMALGKEAADYVSGKFIRPIRLEFEKVYFPFLLINKKRYAGLLWTNPDRYDKMDAKGLEMVRRDNCALVRDVVNTVLHKILIERSISDAQQFVKNVISDLLRNKLDISALVITKALSKSGENYVGKQAHVELAERMRKRDAGSAPSIGDRVPYVMIQGAKGAKGYEKAEDPIYVLENNIPIDTEYYLEHQLAQPLIRIFEGVMDRPESLLVGEHTRTISVPTPSSSAGGGIMKFAVKKITCLGCKTPLKDQEAAVGAVCANCKGREPEIYSKALLQVREGEQLFSQLWTRCQRCQGSLHMDVLCTNRDCPIFYMRRKVQKDLQDSQKTLDRFVW